MALELDGIDARLTIPTWGEDGDFKINVKFLRTEKSCAILGQDAISNLHQLYNGDIKLSIQGYTLTVSNPPAVGGIYDVWIVRIGNTITLYVNGSEKYINCKSDRWQVSYFGAHSSSGGFNNTWFSNSTFVGKWTFEGATPKLNRSYDFEKQYNKDGQPIIYESLKGLSVSGFGLGFDSAAAAWGSTPLGTEDVTGDVGVSNDIIDVDVNLAGNINLLQWGGKYILNVLYSNSLGNYENVQMNLGSVAVWREGIDSIQVAKSLPYERNAFDGVYLYEDISQSATVNSLSVVIDTIVQRSLDAGLDTVSQSMTVDNISVGIETIVQRSLIAGIENISQSMTIDNIGVLVEVITQESLSAGIDNVSQFMTTAIGVTVE